MRSLPRALVQVFTEALRIFSLTRNHDFYSAIGRRYSKTTVDVSRSVECQVDFSFRGPLRQVIVAGVEVKSTLR